MTIRRPKIRLRRAPPLHVFAAALGIAAMAATASAENPERLVSPQSRLTLELTIYNSNVALVRDRRSVQFAKGRNKLALSGVSPSMQPATAALVTNATGTVSLVDQTFAFDLLTPESLLKHSVGRTVSIIKTNPKTGKETVEKGKILSARNGVVLQIGSRIETTIAGRIVYDSLPKTLREGPTLIATFDSGADTETTLDIRYLTGGITWQADYVAELDPKTATLSLQALATITNNSGASYGDASLRLVAGSVNQNAGNVRPTARALGAKQATAVAPSVPSQPVAGLHMYPVEQKLALGDRETMQITLFSSKSVSAKREYRILGNDNFHTRRFGNPLVVNAERILRFKNDKKAGLGVPMPAGTIRVYDSAADAAGTFVGADGIRHTAVGEQVRLTLGRAFDITATRRQTEFRKQGLPKNIYETSHEIDIRNATRQAVRVKVIERIPGDWRILASSGKHTKPSADRAEWSIVVPANGKKTLTYKARVQL